MAPNAARLPRFDLSHLSRASSGGAVSLVERQVSARDTVIGLAASRRTPFVVAALRKARALRARTAYVTCTPRDEFALDVEILRDPVDDRYRLHIGPSPDSPQSLFAWRGSITCLETGERTDIRDLYTRGEFLVSRERQCPLSGRRPASGAIPRP